MRSMRTAGSRAFVVALVLAAAPAAAQGTVASIRTEGEFVAYDAAAKTVTVKVEKPGSGPPAALLAVGQPATFRVEPEGSVLTRTSVSIRGEKGSLEAIESGRTVNVYWRPDAADPKLRFARKIDVILSDEELDLRYGTE
jgi:hypothetical protein